jgi:hypothetical protein
MTAIAPSQRCLVPNPLIAEGCLLGFRLVGWPQNSGRKAVASGLRHVAAIGNDPQPAPRNSLEIRRILNPADDS